MWCKSQHLDEFQFSNGEDKGHLFFLTLPSLILQIKSRALTIDQIDNHTDLLLNLLPSLQSLPACIAAVVDHTLLLGEVVVDVLDVHGSFRDIGEDDGQLYFDGVSGRGDDPDLELFVFEEDLFWFKQTFLEPDL